MKKSKFHFVKAVIMKSAAVLGYWSLLSRPKDKMSNFLTKLLVCYVSHSVGVTGGGEERKGEKVLVEMPIKNIQAVAVLRPLFFWIPIYFVKCLREEERRDRQTERPT